MSSNLLTIANPELAKEYSAKNKLPVSEVTVSMGWKAIWECAKCSYEWEAQVASRSKNYVISKSRGCPNCAGKVANEFTSLVSLFPDIAKYYHSTLNKKPVEEIVAGSHDNVWWFCNKGHEYKSSAMNKTRQNDGCPYCSGRYASPGNNLAEDNSLLAQEFDLEKNFPLTPSDVTPRSAKRYFWLCPNSHSYEARLSDRNGPKSTGCAECNSLAFSNPHLLTEFDYDKNIGIDPKKVSRGASRIRIWWLCSKFGHSYLATPNSRTSKRRPTSCPDCVRNQTSKVEDDLRSKLIFDKILLNIVPGQNASLPIKWRNNKKLRVDILGSYKGLNVVVEYDGWYWHSDQISGGNESFIRDLEKTEALLKEGCLVIRIRESRPDVSLALLPITHKNLLQISFNYSAQSCFSEEFYQEIYSWLLSK